MNTEHGPPPDHMPHGPPPEHNPIDHLPDHLRPPDPSWGDVIGGIWDRLTNPIPRPPTNTG